MHIPKDLIVTSYQRFQWTVFESLTEERVFVSYYYESGHFQGDVVVELDDDEKLNFNAHAVDFLRNQLQEVKGDYNGLLKTKHIFNFHKIVDSSKLIAVWRKMQL